MAVTDTDDWRPPVGVTVQGLIADAPGEARASPAPAGLAGRPHAPVSTGQPISQQLVLVTLRGPLVAHHGAESFQRLERRLQILVRECLDSSCRVVIAVLDDEASMAQLDLRPIERSDADTIKAAIDRVLAVANRDLSGEEGAAHPSLLILGGDDVVPFFRLPNPADDDEPHVLSDNPYGMAPGDSAFTPSIPIGRLPDGLQNSAGLLFRLLDHIDANRRSPVGTHRSSSVSRAGLSALNALVFGRATSDAFVCSSETALPVAEQVAQAISPKTTVRVCPPVTAEEFDARWLANRHYVYFNLHGTPGAPSWYGQAEPDPVTDEPELPRVLYPDLLAAEDLAAPVVFAEASFAAQNLGRGSDSLALRLLSGGAAAVIGPTGFTYGAADRQVAASSLLARLFFRLVRAGQPVGVALARARRELVRICVERQGYLDGDDQKVLLHHVILGDPLATVGRSDETEEPDLIGAGRQSVPCSCHRSSTVEASRDTQVLRVAIQALLDRCPELADGSLRVVRRDVCRGDCGYVGHPSEPTGDALEPIVQVTARKELNLADGEHLMKLARLTISADGEVVKAVASR